MKFFLKTLKVFLFTTVVLIIFSLGSALLLLQWPSLWFKDSVLRKISPLSSFFGIQVEWKQGAFQASSKGLLSKDFNFSVKDFCFSYPKKNLRGCFPEWSGNASLAYRAGIQLIELGPIKLSQGKIWLSVSPASTRKQTPSLFPINIPNIELPDWLHKTQFQDIDLDFAEVSIQQGPETMFRGPLRITSEIKNRSLQAIHIQTPSSQSQYWQQGRVQVQLESPAAFRKNQWSLQIQAQVIGQHQHKLSIQGNITSQNPQAAQFKLILKNKIKGQIGQIQVQGEVFPRQLTAQLSGSFAGVSEEIKRLQFKRCSLELAPIRPKLTESQLVIDCMLQASLRGLELPAAQWKKFAQAPSELDLNVQAQVHSSSGFRWEEPVSGKAQFQLKNISQDLLEAKGRLELELAGIPANYPQDWKLKTNADLLVQLKSFERLVKLLDKTDYAIFAPFNAFKGTAELNLKGRLNYAQQFLEVPVTFKTQLQSAQQKFYSQGKGNLKINGKSPQAKSQLELNLVLDQLQLVMPDLHPEKIPQLFPDRRLKGPNDLAKQTSSQAPIKYSLHLSTAPTKPGYLISNLVKDRIPFFLNLHFFPEKTEGLIRLGQAELDFLRRPIKLSSLELTLQEPRETSPIKGLMQINYANYKIRIQLLGTLERPRVILESDPPLAQEQIIAVLIYGRSFEELNQEQSQSVASVQAAAADRALSIGSLYLFASTPIERVIYNPYTKEFSARLRLADGTSLDLGTRETQEQRVGIRQRLGGNLTIQAYGENDSETGERRGGAFLEWYKRY